MKLLSRSTQKGFTLVEVLISMVVFSLLMVLVSTAMSFATRYWQNEHGDLKLKISEFIYVEKLSRSIASMQPYGVYYGRGQNLRAYFQGLPSNMIFVSDSGLYKKGPAVIALRIVEAQDGSILIQVAESGLKEYMVARESDIQNINWQWKSIKSGLASANFAYYGYRDLSELLLDRTASNRNSTQEQWYESYEAKVTGILPKTIAIRWQEMKEGQLLDYSMEFSVLIDDRLRYSVFESNRYAN